jgi:hypothetical protein
MLLFGALVGAPRYFAYVWPFRQGANGPVFSLVFYRETFPLIVLALLVVGPSLWGIGQGGQTERLRPLFRKVLWIAAIATLPAMVVQNPELSVFLKVFRRREIWGAWQIWLLQLVVYCRLRIWSRAQSDGAGTAAWPRSSRVRRGRTLIHRLGEQTDEHHANSTTFDACFGLATRTGRHRHCG